MQDESVEVEVVFFARARDLAGCESSRLRLPRGATILDARAAIAASYPRLAEMLDQCRFAIDCELASDDAIVVSGAEIAVLPPVSGG